MVIDTSVIMAILLGEAEALRFVNAIHLDISRLMSASSELEASIVVFSRLGDDGARELELLLYKLNCEIIPFTHDQSILAFEGWRRYGKGRHPAGLNFRDCCTYGLCMSTGEPLLFKGNDFSQTDVPIVSC
ncbi:MAG: PIN domain nuclease [Spirochaetes bacterium]|nr:MAG: PIN domain nuclease [Spirochaetota bacterium]